MRYVSAGGVRVSSIGLGCWQFGSRDWGYGKTYGDTTAAKLVHAALDMGVNLIDTAEVYARGASEAIVGRALEGRRDEAFLATKVLPIWPTAERVEEHGRLSSMRLGVASIDLYQVHWPNPLVPALVDDGGDAAPARRGDRRSRGGEQLLGRPLGGRGTATRWSRALQSGAVQPPAAQARPRERSRTRRRTIGS